MGVNYTKERTSITLWIPFAEQVVWRIYDNGIGGKLLKELLLTGHEDGTWSAVINKDLHGRYYTIQVKNHGKWLNEIPDIYAFSTGVNGQRGMIFDPEKTNPEQWKEDQYIHLSHYTDASIYELHVRDFTQHPESGVNNNGLFLGLAEENTHNAIGEKTGLNHLVDLGISHVHLLPISDYCKLDERTPQNGYNWGYDPLNFNTLEGSYSTNPFDGMSRIIEFKKLVQTLHKNHIGVVLDVVYNHTGLVEDAYFDQTIPGYYFRHNTDGQLSNASGCGNEFASEKPMARKYLIDSLKYWCKEYHIDGFRFDLMGIYDIETMNIIEEELRKINPSILLYGEGWTADRSPLDESHRAVKNNTQQLKNIACFSDDFRDTIKGNQFDVHSLGFISGKQYEEEHLKHIIVAGLPHPQIKESYLNNDLKYWADSPQQVINFFSCHDDYTIFDKLKLALDRKDYDTIDERICLGLAINILSQGIPFLHSGVELLRTKKGVQNSYKSPDFVNQIEWDKKNNEVVGICNYLKNLIRLRNEYPFIKCENKQEIQENIEFINNYIPGVVTFIIHNKKKRDKQTSKICISFNNTTKQHHIDVPSGNWKELSIDKYQILKSESKTDIIVSRALSATIYLDL